MLLLCTDLQQVLISVSPERQLFGDKVTLTASVEIDLNAVSYQWLRDNKELSAATDDAYDGVSNRTLTIFPFTHDCEGKYKCSVTCKGSIVLESSFAKLTVGKLT